MKEYFIDKRDLNEVKEKIKALTSTLKTLIILNVIISIITVKSIRFSVGMELFFNGSSSDELKYLTYLHAYGDLYIIFLFSFLIYLWRRKTNRKIVDDERISIVIPVLKLMLLIFNLAIITFVWKSILFFLYSFMQILVYIAVIRSVNTYNKSLD